MPRSYFFRFGLFTLLFLSTQNILAANGITYTSRADLSQGGTHFDMAFDNLSNPVLLYPTWVGVSLNGNTFIMDIYGNDNTRITCNATSCTFFVPGLITTGTYDFYFYVGTATPYTFDDTGFVTEDIPTWWKSTQLIRSDFNIFTGFTDFAFRFTNVPPLVTNVSVAAFSDVNQTGTVSEDSRVNCSPEGNGKFICSFEGGYSLPPLCTEGNGLGCEGYNYYFFGLNFAAITNQSIGAAFYPLNAFEEGTYFGSLNYDQGWPLQQRLNLETFEFQNPTPCSNEDLGYCWEQGYYMRWTQRYLADFLTRMRTNGQFSITRQGADTLVTVGVPRLPVGTKGYGAVLAYYPKSSPISVTEVSLNCSVNTCVPLTITGMNPDDYSFLLRLYNKHPKITYTNENDEEVQFGEELLKTILYDQFDNTPPAITKIIASGSTWHPEFIDAVDGSAPGNGLGYLLSPNLTLPNQGVDKIYIQFSEPVVGFDATKVKLFGVNVADYSSTPGFMTVTYDSANMRGIIQLASSVSKDKLRVAVLDSITDLAMNALDGDSNSTAGGAFSFRFNVLVGDANNDGSVNGGDLPSFAYSFNKSTGNAGYNPRADWNANRSVNGGDLPAFAGKFNQSLPQGEPN